MIHLPHQRHTNTKYIELNTHLCQACWTCVEACPNGVLGKIDIFFHKHARIDDAQACKGCLKCVKACQNQAILPLNRTQNRLSAHMPSLTNQIQ